MKNQQAKTKKAAWPEIKRSNRHHRHLMAAASAAKINSRNGSISEEA